MKTLLASVIIGATLAAGTVGAAAAGATPSATPSPTGKAFGFHAFFAKDITMKTHRGWLVVCLNGHAHPWLRSAHALKSQAALHAHGTRGQSAGLPSPCASPTAKPTT